MARSLWSAVLGGVLGFSTVVSLAQSNATGGAAWTGKVDPWVLTSGASGATEFLVVLADQADLGEAAELPSKQSKGELVVRSLRQVAARSQPAVLAELNRLRAEFRPFWIANMIWVRGDLAVVKAMAERDDVRRVSANPSVKLKTVPNEPEGAPGAPDAVEWGVTKTGAPSVWALGYRGAGVVVAGQDTGYQWDHPALRGKYRGWNGSSATHDYNWHDSIHSGGGVCGANSLVPCDDDAHGTHTMGTMVGDDGGSNQIGMAPDAKWIGCRNMNQGVGTPTTYSECFQWFVAPTTVAGTNPDPSRAPDVINNSWGCPPSEGCTDPMVLKTVVDNTRAAGIVVVVSAGNSGSSCGTITDPPAIYDSAFTVGATSSTDSIASFSSRGPVAVGEFSRVEPDVSAPGVSVRSSVPGSSYGTMSGTSMAGPHVAGQVALLLSAMPAWQGDVDSVEYRIEQTAVPRTSTQTCGDVPGSQIPNNTFGWGRIDALAAVSMADVGVQLADAPDPVAIGSPLTYTVTASNAGPVSATGVIATITLSGAVSFVSASTGCSHSAGTVTCTIGTLAKAGSSEKSVVVTVNAAGPITTSATVTGTLHDPVAANNQAQALTATQGSCVVPAAPELTAPATAASGVDYQVSWTATSPIGSYELQEATDAGFTSPVTVAVSGTTRTYSHSVSPAVTYFYRVRALDTCEGQPIVSGWSATAATLVRAPGASTAFHTLPSCRAFDTREATGPTAAAPALQALARRDFVLAGRCGVPATAAAVSANLTVIPAADGQLRVTPGNQGFTAASAISFRAGTVRANNAVLFLATDGTGTFGVQNDAPGSVDFVLDVTGYFE